MFEQTDSRVIGADAHALGQTVVNAAYHTAAIQLAPTMPFVWQGLSVGSSWGLRLSMNVQIQPGPSGTQVSVRTGAELASESLILIIVCCVLFWPAAAVIAYLAYDDFQKRRLAIVQQFFASAGPIVQSPYGVSMPQGPPMPMG